MYNCTSLRDCKKVNLIIQKDRTIDQKAQNFTKWQIVSSKIGSGALSLLVLAIKTESYKMWIYVIIEIYASIISI